MSTGLSPVTRDYFRLIVSFCAVEKSPRKALPLLYPLLTVTFRPIKHDSYVCEMGSGPDLVARYASYVRYELARERLVCRTENDSVLKCSPKINFRPADPPSPKNVERDPSSIHASLFCRQLVFSPSRYVDPPVGTSLS